MIIFLISKPYVVTPHLHRLAKTVQMRGHNIWYYAELKYTVNSRYLDFGYLE